VRLFPHDETAKFSIGFHADGIISSFLDWRNFWMEEAFVGDGLMFSEIAKGTMSGLADPKEDISVMSLRVRIGTNSLRYSWSPRLRERPEFRKTRTLVRPSRSRGIKWMIQNDGDIRFQAHPTQYAC